MTASTSADSIARDLLRQEHSRLRARVAFFHGCADTVEHTAESREASRRVANALGCLVGKLADAIDRGCAQS